MADSFAKTRFPKLGHFLIGLFLIAAFAATSTVLLFVITAEQLQDSITATDLGTTKTSIGAIRQDVAKVENYYTVLAGFAKKQVQTQEELYDAGIAREAAMTKLVNGVAQIRSFINRADSNSIVEPLRLHAFTETATTPSDRALAFDESVAVYFAPYYAELDRIVAGEAVTRAKAKLESFKTAVYQQLETHTANLAAFNAAASKVSSLQSQADWLERSRKTFDDSVGAPGTPLNNDNYWNLCENFYSFKTLVGEAAYKIVLLPKMMLVLLLAIFMGVLGSLIGISRDFLRDPEGRTFWEILFRIGLGAGVAFALFFFAAAGMLAFGQEAHAAGPQAQLSPYLISFLGITAGYLSDRVTAWMCAVGGRVFKLGDDDEPERWAIGLKAESETQNIATPVLAKAIGVPAEEVTAWIAVTRAVPPESQKALALYLHADRSRLFTDIEPARG
jgi:hypothetical protein